MKLQQIELNVIVKDFYKIKTRGERLVHIYIPVLLGVASFVYLLACSDYVCNFDIATFFSDYNSSQITVMALFISFSMAYLTILITSTSKNVEDIKTTESKKYKLEDKPVFLFQILLIDISYLIIIEIILLIFAFVEKFLVIISSSTIINIYISLDIIFLAHIVFLLLRNLKNIYFTFWKAR